MGAVRGEGSGGAIDLTWIEQVIQSLNRAGLRAERAFPGKRLPELMLPQVAVGVHRWEPETGSLTLRASVMSPAALGGGRCEDTAGLVCQVLSQMGGVCVQEGCENVSRTELLCVRVTAQFQQEEEQVRFAVSVGNAPMTGVTAFAAWRNKQEMESVLQDASWQFRLEALGAPEMTFSAEPCMISVERDGIREQYSGCELTGQRVEVDPEGMRYIWEGTAQQRTAG